MEEVDQLIYRQKAGEVIGAEEYLRFCLSLRSKGAEAILLACTEISVAFSGECREGVLDALELLARNAVIACGAPLKKEVLSCDPIRTFA